MLNEHDISSETPAVSIWTLVFNARPSEIKYFINHGEQFGEYIFGLLLVVTPLCSPLGSGRAQAIRPALSRSDPDWRGPGLRLPRPNRLTDWVETWETGVKIDADDRNSIGISIGVIVFFFTREKLKTIHEYKRKCLNMTTATKLVSFERQSPPEYLEKRMSTISQAKRQLCRFEHWYLMPARARFNI